MDAAQTITKKIGFFLATALLLTAPFQAFAQPTLNASSTSVDIGSSSCNDFQTVTLTSSGASIPFTVAVSYPNETNGLGTGDANGNWLYSTISGSGTTSTSATFAGATGTSTTPGVTLTIGLNRSIGAVTDTGQIVITPTNNPSGAVTITVFYSQNTSCGGNTGSASNGIISVTPGNVSLTAGTTGQQSQTVSITNLTGSGYVFAASVNPSGTWLSVSSSSTTITPDGTTTVNVTANATQTSGVGNYSGTLIITPGAGYGGAVLNIPVTFAVTAGSGSGGGGTTGGTLTVGNTGNNTYTAPAFDVISPNTPAGQCIPLQDSAAGANYYTAAVSTSNGGNWLLANNSLNTTVSGLLAASAQACVELSLSNVASTLASGAYQGQVALTSSSGATATILVNLYVSAGAAPGITVQPNLIYVFPNVASGGSVVQQQVFTISASAGYTLGIAALGNAGNGFSITTPVVSNNTESFTFTSNSTGLITGVYSTTVTVSSTFGSSTNSTTITIVQPVGQTGVANFGGGSTSTSVVAPLTLAFQQQYGSSFWTGGKEAQAITITGAAGTQWSASVVYGTGANWLTFDQPNGSSGTFGNTPATVLVDLFNGIVNLGPSNTPYQATVSITTPSGTTTVAVTLLITQQNTPVLLGLPASATFSTVTGAGTTNQTVTIVGSDNTSSTTTPPITAGSPTQTWVTASTSGNSLTIGVNPSGQSTGVYSATIPVSASAYNNPIQYPVIMIVNGGGGGSTTNNGPLTLSPTSISLTGVTGSTSENLGITAATTVAFSAVSLESTCTNSNWLQITSGQYTASQTATNLTVTVNPAGISNGTTCSGSISLVTANATQSVPVSMTVGTVSSGGNVTLTPTTIQPFAYTQGQSVPSAQTVAIASASGSAPIPFGVTTTETNGTSTTWLIAGTTSASTPYSLSISVAPGNLSPGTYTGTVQIAPSGGTAQNISVTLTVTGSAVVSATPTTISMSYQVGGTSPTTTVQVSGGGASAAFTATAVSSAGWLAVSPTSGTTPNTGTFPLTVSIVPTVLSSLLPGGSPYSGTITVTGTSPATGTTIIQVTLTVTAPLPAITGITNGASFANAVSTGISPGEIISIFATANNPIGPATAVSLATTCASPCTQVPTTMSGVTVKFLPGQELAPLLAVSSGQINAVVPYSVAGLANLSVEVTYLGQTSNAFPVTLTPTAPGVFTATASGSGQAAANQYDNLGVFQGANLPATPAKVGWTLVLYMTGEGNVSPEPTSGVVTVATSGHPPTPVPLVSCNVLIGNQPATVSFCGEAPGLVSGVLQINVIVPPGAGTGPVTLSVSLGTASSQANVTVSLQ